MKIGSNHVINLDGTWKIKPLGNIPVPAVVPDSGFTADVPGTVHTDLIAAGVMPDPFYRENESLVQWVEDLDWEYSKEFELSGEELSFPSISLIFDGIDTVADVFLNGKKILHAQNMFITHRARIEHYLKSGKNVLRVVIRSAKAFAIAREKKYGEIFAELDTYRVHIRKAQYSFGWDWGPRLATCGIWRSVRIECVRHLTIEEAHLSTINVSGKGISALFTARLDPVSGVHHAKEVKLSIGDGESRWEFTMPATKRVRRELRLKGAEAWWTHDHGTPKLYDVSVEVIGKDGEILSTRKFRTGFKSIKLLRKRDVTGEGFIFELNGRKIFAKGADWIPSDSFLPRVRESDYRALVKAARNANMNMLRVWGGGVYEDERFYEACDENGILVWQDFMFACASYPEYGAFVEEVENEANENVRRISNHPCIAIFCGNNESEWIWRTRTGRPVDEMPGTLLFKSRLRAITQRIAPEIPYWRSSPFGGDYPDSQAEGNHHQWEVWSAFKPPSEYLKNTARFVTEFGFQAPPSLATIGKFTVPEDRDMQSRVMRSHNKQVEGTERLFRFLAGEAKIGDTFDDVVLQMQLVQARAIKTGVEHWRTRKWNTAGTLYWQLNDCWPVSSWSAVDYYKHPKALYYWSSGFFKPFRIIVTDEGDDSGVYLVNDSGLPVDGRVEVSICDLTGREFGKHTRSFRANANSAKKVTSVCSTALEKDKMFIRARFFELKGGKLLDEDYHLCVPWLDFKFERPTITMETSTEGRQGIIKLNTDRYVEGVYLPFGEKVDQLSDNFFALFPGTQKVVTFRDMSLPEDLNPKLPLLAS